MAAQSWRRHYLSLAIVAAVLVSAVWLARTHADALKEFIDHHTILGIAVYVILNILDAVVAPGATLPLIPIAARAWGHILAALVTTVGWTVGSLVAFYIARRWGVPIVKTLTSMERVKRLRPYVPKDPFWSVVLLRLVVPMDVISYVLGLFTEMTWLRYGLATALGLTPSAFILTYIGKTPRAYDIIMFGIGGAVLAWMVYSTRRGARTQGIAKLAARHSRAQSTHRRPSRRRYTAMFMSTVFSSGTLFADPVQVRAGCLLLPALVRSLRPSPGMPIRQLDRDSWRQELDSFSRQHEGWIVSITTRSRQGEFAVSAHDVPLQGVSAASPRSNDITVAVGHGRGQLTHEVEDATAVQVDLTADQAERALIIHGGNGTTTTIEFRSPMRPEEVDGLPARDRQ